MDQDNGVITVDESTRIWLSSAAAQIPNQMVQLIGLSVALGMALGASVYLVTTNPAIVAAVAGIAILVALGLVFRHASRTKAWVPLIIASAGEAREWTDTSITFVEAGAGTWAVLWNAATDSADSEDGVPVNDSIASAGGEVVEGGADDADDVAGPEMAVLLLPGQEIPAGEFIASSTHGQAESGAVVIIRTEGGKILWPAKPAFDAAFARQLLRQIEEPTPEELAAE